MKRFCAVLFRLLLLCAALLCLVLLLQGPVAHRTPPFVPDYPQEDLGPILIKPQLEEEDYRTLFLQTGLGRGAVDRLLTAGAVGVTRILETQTAFFHPLEVVCDPIAGLFVKEDHLETSHGEKAWGPPIVDLHPGDILLTYSTHSLGWRHGHAGLVVDNLGDGATLEAVLVGTDSAVMDAVHWRDYSNYMVLRLRSMTPALQEELVDYALENLVDVPYRLTSGFSGLKEPGDGAFGLQCSYLVWYAFQHFGSDLDSDGGRLVTVDDLANSPLLEVVQIYGLDPRAWESD